MCVNVSTEYVEALRDEHHPILAEHVSVMEEFS